MADDVIKSFLIALGFKVDEAGLKKFNNTIKEVEKSAKQFAIGFTALAVGIEESIRRVGKQYEQLFFLSAQLGTSANNLKSLQFAFSQIGVSAGSFTSALNTLNAKMLDSPGMRHYIAGLIPSFNAATGTADQALMGLARKYADILKMPDSAEKKAAEANYRGILARALGLNPDDIRQTALHLDILEKWKKKSDEWLAAIGLDSDKAARQSFEAMQAWGFAWMQITTIFERFTLTVMPAVQGVLTRFSDWLKSPEGTAQIKKWADALEAWASDPKNIKDMGDKLIAVANGALALTKAVGELLSWLGWLNEAIGATGTLLVALFGFTIAKGVVFGLTKGAIALMFAPLIAGATTAGGAAGAAFAGAFTGGLGSLMAKLGFLGRFLTPIGAAAVVMTPSETNKGEKEGLEKFKGMTPEQQWKAMGGTGAPPKPGEVSKEIARDPNRPGSYEGPPIGGQSSLIENMVLGFQHWWAGSGNFRPRVDLVDTVYNKVADMLRDVFDLKPGGQKLEAAQPGSGGRGSGEGGDGERRGSGMPGRSGGGRVSPDSGAPGEGDLSQAALDAISKGEGTFKSGTIDYNTVYGGKNVDLANMTLNKVMEMQKQMIATTGHSPVGAFQITRETIEGLVKQLKLDPEKTMMSPEIQRQMASQLYRTRGLQPWVNPQTASGETQRTFRQLQQSGGLWAGGGGEHAGHDHGPAGGRGLARGRDLAGVKEALVETVNAAAKMMPEGYKVVPTSGFRRENSGQHGRGNAMDVQIVGPDGKPIANEGKDVTGMYTKFAHHWYNAALKMYPHLAEQAAWGGEFGTEKGGSGPLDLMHVDFGGRRGRYRSDKWRYKAAEANQRVAAYAKNFGEGEDYGGGGDEPPRRAASLTRGVGMSPEPYRQTAANNSRSLNVGDTSSNVVVNMHGVQDQSVATKTAQAIEEVNRRHALVAARNLRAAVA